MRYSESFYLDLLGFLKNKFPSFYWGEYGAGYQWGYSSKDIHKIGFPTLQHLVDNIFDYISLEEGEL